MKKKKEKKRGHFPFFLYFLIFLKVQKKEKKVFDWQPIPKQTKYGCLTHIKIPFWGKWSAGCVLSEELTWIPIGFSFEKFIFRQAIVNSNNIYFLSYSSQKKNQNGFKTVFSVTTTNYESIYNLNSVHHPWNIITSFSNKYFTRN